jgi:succinate dehydrogenase / fumarate reductase flavoprotein subunit
MWEFCGMARTKAGLEKALQQIPALREEFWGNVRVPGSADTLNQSLEQAGRVADFLELGELMCLDALTRIQYLQNQWLTANSDRQSGPCFD